MFQILATVTIKADGKNPCNADFNIFSDSSNIYKYKFVAIDTSETDYNWYFPTTGSTKKKVDYTFTKAGNYSICLNVQTQNEHCVEIRCKTIKVGACKAKFGYSINNQKKTVNFSDSSTVKNTKYYWVFGDGKTSFLQKILHTLIVNLAIIEFCL